MTSLEHRYRRLIALYPAAHRRRYQMEMLSTLMDGASESQRAPRLRESIDLIWNAIWLRLNRDGPPPGRDQRWAAAAGIFGPLGALTVAALYVMIPLGDLGWQRRLAGVEAPVSEGGWRMEIDWVARADWVALAQGGAWLVVAVIALVGWRRMAAILAWATVAATFAASVAAAVAATAASPVAMALNADPMAIVRGWPLIVFGVTVAGGLTLSRGRIALPARLVAVFGAVTAACAVSLWADAMIAHVEVHPDRRGYLVDLWGMNFPSVPGIDTAGALPTVLFAAFLAVVVWVQYSVDRRVRRRLRAYALVPLITYVFTTNVFSDNHLLGTIWQWLNLILVPAATFIIGVIIVRRKDTWQHLIELGRAQL